VVGGGGQCVGRGHPRQFRVELFALQWNRYEWVGDLDEMRRDK
jgi:hypothetical protein